MQSPRLFGRQPRGVLRPTQRTREAFALYCDGLSQKDIAVQFDVAVGTVEVWLRQCVDADRDERMSR